jgi:methylthioribose-1-phosphate isomerase
VFHDKHRLPHEVTLLKDETFPRCSQCGAAVEFELIRAAPGMDAVGGFRVVLYELPAENQAAENAEEKADAESAWRSLLE